MKFSALSLIFAIASSLAVIHPIDAHAICIDWDEGRECTKPPESPRPNVPTTPTSVPTPPFVVTTPSGGGVNIHKPETNIQSNRIEHGGWIKQDAMVIPSSNIREK
jgi:hypothetical protein